MSKEGKITGQKLPLSKIVVEKQTLNLLLGQCDHVKITQSSFSLYIEESVKKATFHSNNLTSMVVLWFLKSQILRCNHYKKNPFHLIMYLTSSKNTSHPLSVLVPVIYVSVPETCACQALANLSRSLFYQVSNRSSQIRRTVVYGHICFYI